MRINDGLCKIEITCKIDSSTRIDGSSSAVESRVALSTLHSSERDSVTVEVHGDNLVVGMIGKSCK